MTKKIILPLIAILLLSSCANKFSLQKRKYNKGYYFANSKSNMVKNKDVAISNLQINNLSPKTTYLTSQKSIEKELLFKPILLKQNDLESINSIPKKIEKKNNITASSSKTKITQFKNLKTLNLKKIKNNKSEESDIKLILLVILAILIPPLAVYLKNQKIDKWFWITLILCLLTFSFFIFAFGGLLYLLAIIFALLYLFDVVK